MMWRVAVVVGIAIGYWLTCMVVVWMGHRG